MCITHGPTLRRAKYIVTQKAFLRVLAYFTILHLSSLFITKMEAENQYKKGLWTEEEDQILLEYIRVHGRGKWNRIPKVTGKKVMYIYIYIRNEL